MSNTPQRNPNRIGALWNNQDKASKKNFVSGELEINNVKTKVNLTPNTSPQSDKSPKFYLELFPSKGEESRVGNLWQRKSEKTGQFYLSGNVTIDNTKYNISIFNNKTKLNQNSPDFSVYLQVNSAPAATPAATAPAPRPTRPASPKPADTMVEPAEPEIPDSAWLEN